MDVWRLLVVDDDEVICNQIKDFLEGEKGNDGESIEVEIINEFSRALETLEKQRFDLVILDLRVGSLEDYPEEEAGEKTLQAVKKRLFIPVIFHTGLPHLAEDLKSDLVDVITKSGDLDQLLDAIKKMFETKLPQINKAITRHVEEVQRQYMWDFVAKHWSDFGKPDNEGELAYLLTRRLALSLSVTNIRELKTELGSLIGKVLEDSSQNESISHAHPVTYYICPVISKNHRTGDLYKHQDGDFYVLLTPSCDLVIRNNIRCKAEQVLIAKCVLLEQQEEYLNWNNPTNLNKTQLEKLQKKLKSLMTNGKVDGRQEDRFYFLPGVQALNIPDLIIDLHQLHNVSYVEFDTPKPWERRASLDRPYAEALSAKLTRYLGRIGTPDLNTQVVLDRLRSTQIPEKTQEESSTKNNVKPLLGDSLRHSP